MPNTPTALCENVAAIMTAFVFRTISYSLYCLLLPVLFVYYFSFINILNKLLFVSFHLHFCLIFSNYVISVCNFISFLIICFLFKL